MSVSSDWNPASAGFVDLEKQTLDIWALALRRKWLILFMLLVGAALGYLYYEKATRVYESTAKVLVAKHRTDPNLPIKSLEAGNDFETRLTNHILLIKMPVVVQRAVEKFHLHELTSFQDIQPHNIAGVIIANMESGRAGGRDATDTDIMEIRYRSTHFLDTMNVLRAVIKSYQDFLSENYQDASEETIRKITQAREELGAALTKDRSELQRFVKEAPGGIEYDAAGHTNPAEETKRKIMAQRLEIDSRRAELRATIKTVETAQSEGRSTDSILLHLQNYRKAEGLDESQQQVQSNADMLFPHMLELSRLQEKFGPEHPQVKEAALRVQLIREQLELIQARNFQETVTRRTPELFIANVLETLRLDLENLDNKDKELAVAEDAAEKQSQYLQSFQAEYRRLQNEIKSKQELYDLVLDRLRQIDLGANDGGFKTNTVAEPDSAAQVEPNLLKVLSVAGFLGLAVGMGLAYLVDLADKSFRNPEEVRHELGMPILGHLPVIVSESRRRKKDAPVSAVSDIVCTHHRPKSTYSEAYRAVRTALNFGIRGEGHKVIQVTSPDPGDGKSTLSGNLAVCMAQSGRRVLLVDADFRRPRVHRLFGVDAGLGMSAVIKGTADLPEAIVPTEVENLFLLPCGPRPSNPSELLSSTRFSELIHVLREQYDIVIIDTPPVLAVTDPCVVAPRVDGVVLLIRITKHVRPHAKRALESLESLGANLIGIVVNGVGGNRPGMGYGFGSQYGYRYATNSGYYDSYSYNYGGYHHYYEDADTPSEEQVLRSEGYVREPQEEKS